MSIDFYVLRDCIVNFQMRPYAKYQSVATFLMCRSLMLSPGWSRNLFSLVNHKGRNLTLSPPSLFLWLLVLYKQIFSISNLSSWFNIVMTLVCQLQCHSSSNVDNITNVPKVLWHPVHSVINCNIYAISKYFRILGHISFSFTLILRARVYDRWMIAWSSASLSGLSLDIFAGER